MKRLLAICMLTVLMFNIIGYYFGFLLLSMRADKKLENTIETNHYDRGKLIEIKIPLNLPYQTAWTDFESTDGEIELNDTVYRYVQRKVIQNYLVLLCLPNIAKMLISSARDRFFEQANGLQKSAQHKSANIIKFNINDYFIQQVHCVKVVQPLMFLSYSAKNKILYSFCFLNTLLKPPRTLIASITY